MAVEAKIKEACGTLKELQDTHGHKGGIREETRFLNYHRIRAILEKCGSCTNLEIEHKFENGRMRVGLGCAIRLNSPVDLSIRTPLGQPFNCDDYESVQPQTLESLGIPEIS